MLKLLWLLGYDAARAELVSPFRLSECVARLRQGTNSDWAFFGPSPVSGRVGEESFRLYKKKFFLDPHAATIVHGNFIEEAQQTRVFCRFGFRRHPVVSIVAGCIVTALVVVTALMRMHSAPTPRGTLIVGAFAIFMLAIAIQATRHRLRCLRDEQEFLLEFVIATLGAREGPLSSAGIHELGRSIFLEQIRGEP